MEKERRKMKEKKANILPFIAVLCYCQSNFHVISRETEWFVDFFFSSADFISDSCFMNKFRACFNRADYVFSIQKTTNPW